MIPESSRFHGLGYPFSRIGIRNMLQHTTVVDFNNHAWSPFLQRLSRLPGPVFNTLLKCAGDDYYKCHGPVIGDVYGMVMICIIQYRLYMWGL